MCGAEGDAGWRYIGAEFAIEGSFRLSELEALGVLSGTDKSSTHAYSWDYLRHYEELFRPWKSQKINLIEIGVERGASLEMWVRYFDQATIVGIDINAECARLAGDRAVIKIGSQENPDFLSKVASEYPPAIIIDDGSHLAHHMIASFEALFPALAPGGIYIFEDLSFHFEDGVGQWRGFKVHQGLSNQSIYEYLAPFQRARLANLNTPPAAWGFARYAFENIDSIISFGGALAIRKRAKRPLEEEIAAIENLLPGSPDINLARHRYAAYLVKHNVRLERAYELTKQVCEVSPNDIQALELIYVVTSVTRRFEEALTHALKLASLRPTLSRSWQRAAEAYRRTNRQDAELGALQRLLQIEPDAVNALLRVSALREQLGDLKGALASAQRVVELAPQDAQAAGRVQALATQIG